DTDARIVAFNPAAEAMFGYSAAEAIGENVSLLMPEPHRSAHDSYLARYHRSGETSVVGHGRHVEACRRDGTVFPAHVTVAEIDLDGRRVYAGYLHDLTDQLAELEARRLSEETLRVLVDNLARHIVALLDADGKV